MGIDTPATIEAIDRKTRKVNAKLASGLSQDFFYAPTVEILTYAPNEVKIQLDQLLALAPNSFPLHVGQKVVIHWTYQDRKRAALRFKIDPPQATP